MAVPLPDPVWDPDPANCARCGYALGGLARPGVCPECSLPFAERHLIMAGLVSRARRAPLGRRIAWVAVIGAFVAITMLWPVFLVFDALLLVVTLLVATGGLAWLLATSRRERRSTERFLFTPGGVARLALTAQQRGPGASATSGAGHDSVFTPWDGANAVEFKRISPYWRRIRIGIAQPGGPLQRTVFEAGVRCPDSTAAGAEQAVRELVARGLIAPAPHPTPRHGADGPDRDRS